MYQLTVSMHFIMYIKSIRLWAFDEAVEIDLCHDVTGAPELRQET